MATTVVPSDTMQVFFECVRGLMAKKEITQRELANRAGVDPIGLNRMLNGKNGNCSFATADKIAKALGTTTIEILKKAD